MTTGWISSEGQSNLLAYALHSVAPTVNSPEANRGGITRPFSLLLGYGTRRPSFGRPVVIVLLDKNFHLAWHANDCMKHMSLAVDTVVRSHLHPAFQKILTVWSIDTLLAETRKATVRLFASSCKINMTLLFLLQIYDLTDDVGKPDSSWGRHWYQTVSRPK